MGAFWLRLGTRLRQHSEGQGLVEYGLIIILIGVVVIAVLIILGNQVKNAFCNVSGGLSL